MFKPLAIVFYVIATKVILKLIPLPYHQQSDFFLIQMKGLKMVLNLYYIIYFT